MGFSKIMGIIFCVLGALGCIVVIASFDYSYYNDIRGLPLTHGDEFEIMQQELFATWLIGIVVLISNVAIGSLLITLDHILEELRGLRKKQEVTVNPDAN